MLSVSSRPLRLINATSRQSNATRDFDPHAFEELPNDPSQFDGTIILSEFCKIAYTYIGGFVIRTIKKSMKCEECIVSLEDHPERRFCDLIQKRNYGGLITPSIYVCKVIDQAERVLQGALWQKEVQSEIGHIPPLRLTAEVLKHFFHDNGSDKIFPQLDGHELDGNPLENRKYLLVKAMTLKYLQTRIHFICCQTVDSSQSRRQFLNKVILFSGH